MYEELYKLIHAGHTTLAWAYQNARWNGCNWTFEHFRAAFYESASKKIAP